MRDANPQTIYLKDYTVPEYHIQNVELTFNLDEDCTEVLAKLTLLRNSTSQTGGLALTLTGENLTLLRVALDDNDLQASAYSQNSDGWAFTKCRKTARFCSP